jgi:hypothetical protein
MNYKFYGIVVTGLNFVFLGLCFNTSYHLLSKEVSNKFPATSTIKKKSYSQLNHNLLKLIFFIKINNYFKKQTMI